MIRCHQCNTDNLDGSEYCDECGTKLNPSTPVRSVYSQPAHGALPPPTFVGERITPKPATPYMAPPPAPPPIQMSVPPQINQTVAANPPVATNVVAGHTAPLRAPEQTTVAERGTHAARAKLIIQRGGKIGKEFPITNSDSMIGRWDADGGIFPDVDLDQDDPEAKVSRRHARIQFLNSQYVIEDMGSTNGTFINRGPRLLPGSKQPLNNGDEIIVGKTFLKFVVN